MVTDYLVFNSGIARVQGCMLLRKGGKEMPINIGKLIQTIKAEVSRGSSKLKMEIFLFLLIHTNLDWSEEFLDNGNFSSLANICSRLHPEQFVEIVSSSDLWENLFECFPHLPPSVQVVLMRESVRVLQDPGSSRVDRAVWTAVGRSAKYLQDQDQTITDYLNFVSHPQSPGKELNLMLISLLAVLRSHLEDDDVERNADLSHLFSTVAKSRTVKQETVTTKLLGKLKQCLSDLDFDSWMELSEIESSQLMKTNSISKVWRKDDIPTNLQFIAAHLISEVEELMKGGKREGTSEVCMVLSSFSRPYTREVELGLDDLSLVEIMEIIDNMVPMQDANEWKLDLYLDKMMKDFLEELLNNQDYLNRLSPYVDRLSSSLENIYFTLATSSSERQTKFFFDIARHSTLNALSVLLKESVERLGLVQTFQTASFDLEFVDAFNRVSGDGSEEFKQDFLLLALQNPRRTVESLVEEGSKFGGQIGTIVEVLTFLSPVCQCLDGGRTLLSGLMSKSIVEKSEKEQENSINLHLRITNTNKEIGTEVIFLTLPYIYRLYASTKESECLVLMEACQKTLDIPGFPASLTVSVTRSCHVTILWILNQVYCKNDPVSFDIRVLCLRLISELNTRSEVDLGPFLKPDLHSYFLLKAEKSSLLLRDVVQWTFIKGELIDDFLNGFVDTEEVTLFSQSLGMIPFLSKEEFHYLYKILMRIFELKNNDFPKLKTYSIFSRVFQTMIKTKQSGLRRMCLLYSGLYTAEIKSAEPDFLLNLYRCLIRDICIVKVNACEAGNVTAVHTEVQSEQFLEQLLQPLWASSQAAVAEILSRCPTEDDLRCILLPLSTIQSCLGKDMLVKLVENHLNLL